MRDGYCWHVGWSAGAAARRVTAFPPCHSRTDLRTFSPPAGSQHSWIPTIDYRRPHRLAKSRPGSPQGNGMAVDVECISTGSIISAHGLLCYQRRRCWCRDQCATEDADAQASRNGATHLAMGRGRGHYTSAKPHHAAADDDGDASPRPGMSNRRPASPFRHGVVGEEFYVATPTRS